MILGLGWSFPCDIWSLGCILVELLSGELRVVLVRVCGMPPTGEKLLQRWGWGECSVAETPKAMFWVGHWSPMKQLPTGG